MSNFDGIKKAAKETMGTLADKSMELYRIAEEKTRLVARRTKLSAEIAVEKGSVRNLYKDIGKVYYELHRDEPEPAMKQLIAEIDAAMDLIALKQKELDDLKCDAACYEDDMEPTTVEELPVLEGTEPLAREAQVTQIQDAPVPETPDAQPQDSPVPSPDDWQKKYPPEFRI